MIDTPMTAEEYCPWQRILSRGRCRECLRPAVRLPGFSRNISIRSFAGLLREIAGTALRSHCADAETVAKKYLHPEQMILICVGDRAKIEPELKKLELGASSRRRRWQDYSVDLACFPRGSLAGQKLRCLVSTCGKKYFRDARLFLRAGISVSRNRPAQHTSRRPCFFASVIPLTAAPAYCAAPKNREAITSLFLPLPKRSFRCLRSPV